MDKSMPQTRRAAKEVIGRLVEQFPKCFSPWGTAKRPLKIGITEDIRKRMIVGRGRLHVALYYYTDGPSYLDSLIEGVDRIDLDGNPCGKVDAAQAREAARRSLGVREARRIDAQIKAVWKVLTEFGFAPEGANWHDDPAPFVHTAFEKMGMKNAEANYKGEAGRVHQAPNGGAALSADDSSQSGHQQL